MGYEVIVVEDAHTTNNQVDRTASEIIQEYNDKFRSVAEVRPAETLLF